MTKSLSPSNVRSKLSWLPEYIEKVLDGTVKTVSEREALEKARDVTRSALKYFEALKGKLNPLGLRKWDLVQIEWLDICTHDEWMDESEARDKYKPARHITVGQVFHYCSEREPWWTLVSTKSIDLDQKQVCQAITIPYECVKSITKCKVVVIDE